MTWIETYKNHILYSSAYVAIGASAFASTSSSSSSSLRDNGRTVTDALLWMVAGISALCLTSEIKYVIKRRRLPPGGSGLPFFGHLFELLRDGPFDMKLRHLERFGGTTSTTPVTFNLMMQPIVLFSDDEDVQWCLSQERKGNLIPNLMDHVRALIGEEAIMMQHSTKHRRLRKMFEPSFSPAVVRSYTQIIDTTTKRELEKWCKRGEFCSSKEWAMLAMRLFCTCAFGDDAINDSSLQRLSDLFETWVEGFLAPIPVAIIPGTKLYNGHVAKKQLAAALQEMVEDFKSKNPPGSDGAENSMMGRLCYGVDDDGKTLPMNELTCNIQFILFAGHDTTKGSFSAFIHYLDKHPEIKTLLVKEAETFSEPLDPDQLKAAPLLNAFLAEIWRLVAPLDAHNLKATTSLEYKGYKIPAGTGVGLELQAASIMHPDKYPNPREFRLERWLPKDHPLHDPKFFVGGVDYNAMSVKYRAFNMGSHMCLGGHFAKLEARIVLTRLLQTYDMKVQNDKLVLFPLRQYDNEFKLCRKTEQS